jgi:hypothetical protein
MEKTQARKNSTPITAFCAPKAPTTSGVRFQNTTLGIKEKRNSPPGSSERASRDCRALALGESNQMGFVIAQIHRFTETRRTWNGALIGELEFLVANSGDVLKLRIPRCGVTFVKT